MHPWAARLDSPHPSKHSEPKGSKKVRLNLALLPTQGPPQRDTVW